MPSNTIRRGRGNTSGLSLQEGGMPIASPSTITAPRLRESRPFTRHADRGHGAADGIRPANHAGFQQFVDSNRHLFVDYVSRRLEGHHAGAAEDALQEGLIQIWNEWNEWPDDESERIRFARQALRIAALQAIRRRTGRDDSPRAGEITVDFADLDGPARPAPAAERLARDLGRAIAEQSMVKDQLGYLEKASLVAAIATLTDLEQRVLFMTAQGDDCKEIADDLGVTHQQAREALMRARRLCRMLIEHADGQKVSEKEAKMLWQYADGQLSGKRARELKRHVDHCTACQRLLGLEESIGTNGALVVLPIPVLLLATGKTFAGGGATAAASTAGSTGGAAGTAGADLGVQLGGTVLAPAATKVTFGSVLAGATAKVGLALGALAATGSIAGVYKLAHDRQAQREATAIVARAPARSQPRDANLAAVAPAPTRTTAAKPAPAKRTKKRSRPATRSARPTQRTATTSSAPAARPAATAPARTAPTAPQRSTRPASSTGSGGSGGEFVLGSR